MTDPQMLEIYVPAIAALFGTVVGGMICYAIGSKQNDTAHAGLFVSLFDKRYAWIKRIGDAIEARNQEIIRTDFHNLHEQYDTPPALKELWLAMDEGKLLFGEDVTGKLTAVETALRAKYVTLGEIRTNPDYARSLHDVVTENSNGILTASSELRRAATSYAFVGDIKRPPETFRLETISFSNVGGVMIPIPKFRRGHKNANDV